MAVDWTMIGSLVTVIAALSGAAYSLAMLHDQDQEYLSLLLLLNRDLEEARIRAATPKSCLPVAIPSFEIIVARGLARRWPTRLRDREKYQVRRR